MKRRRPLRGCALGVALVLAALPGARAVAADDPRAASWAEVGFTWAPLERRLRNDSCAEHRDRFEACLLALAALGAGREPPALPVPDTGKTGAVWRDAPRSVAPPFSLEARAERERGLVARWASESTPAVDFEALFRELRQRVEPDAAPGLAARGVAAYLRRAVDPHTAIAPYPAVDAAYHHAARGTPVHAFFRRRQGDETVESETVFERGFSLVWVRVHHFDDVACFEVSSALATAIERGARGVLLDLRGNLGGVSREAACIADLFLPARTEIVRIEPIVADFERRVLQAQSGVVVDAPVAVLVDSWSASGAEVVAAALQTTGRGIVVGARTFGKGTYQEAAPWAEHPDVVYYRTTARLVVGAGYEFQMHGVLPDLPVDDESPPAEAPVLREDNAYVNPIPAVHPPVPPRRTAALEACVAGRSAEPVGSDGDRAALTARRALWCWLSGRLPGS